MQCCVCHVLTCISTKDSTLLSIFFFSLFSLSFHYALYPFSWLSYLSLLFTLLSINPPISRATETMPCEAQERLQPIRPIYKLYPTTTPTTPSNSEIVHIVVQLDSESKEIALWEDIVHAFKNAINVRHGTMILPFLKDKDLKKYLLLSQTLTLRLVSFCMAQTRKKRIQRFLML